MEKSQWLAVLICLLCVLVPEQGWTLTVRDQLHRRVEITREPQRIVSLAPSITECIFALGQGQKVVGTTLFSTYPPEARDLPKVGSYVHLDLERILGLNPDLCLATKDGNPIKIIERLERLGVPVYALDPRDFHSVMETVIELGKLLGARDRAEMVVRKMRQRLNRIQESQGQDWKRPRVFFQIGISPIISVGTQTFVHELIRLAGGINLAAGPTPYPHYTREEVLVLDPDIILINSMTGNTELAQRAREQWKQFPQLSAARDDTIYAVDSDLFNRPSPRLLSALEILFEIVNKQQGSN